MSGDEATLIGQLSDKLSVYHEEVVRHVTRCVGCRKKVNATHTEVFGRPGDDMAPGLKTKVSSLDQSRIYLRRGLQATWALLLVVLGALGEFAALHLF
jgi:hypothetical protein